MQERLLSGAFWNMLATIASKGFTVFAGIIVARLLGAELYGEVGMVQSSATMFQVLAVCGIGLTCSKYVAELKKSDPYSAGEVIGFSLVFSVLFGIVIAGVFFILSPFLAGCILNKESIVLLLRMSSVLLFLGALNGVQTGILSGFEAFRSQSVVNFFSGLITFLCIVLAAYAWKTAGVILGMIAGGISQCCFNIYTIKKFLVKYKIKITMRYFRNQFVLIYKFSIPAMMSGLIYWVSIWIGNAMLVNQHDGYTQLGIYNAGYQWFSIILFLPSILTGAILPIMSERKGAKDFSTMRNVLFFSIKSSFFFVFPVCIIFSILSPYIMKMYGEGFEAHWDVLVLILVMALFTCVQNMMSNTFAVVEKMWLNFSLNFAWGVLYIFLIVILLRNGLGAIGLALAGLFASIVRFALTVIFSFKVLKSAR